MPIDVYEKVKNEIPKDIGCYVLEQSKWRLDSYRFYCVKRCKPKQLETSKELLLANMLRSARNKTNLEVVASLYRDERATDEEDLEICND